MLDELLFANYLGTVGALVGIFGACIEACGNDSNGSCCYGVAAVVKCRHGDFESITFFANHAGFVYSHVFEEDLTCIARSYT